MRKVCQSKIMIVWQKLTDKMTDNRLLMAKKHICSTLFKQ
ncbi:hypothetical protein HMPREF2534_02800 [Bacteroides thetaiotaomicron]|nr:hypothetical protein HMPREF2534_02800 [Bacteroides thetaiotaomicron]